MNKIKRLKKWSIVMTGILLYVIFPNADVGIKGKIIGTEDNVLPGTAVRIQAILAGATTGDDCVPNNMEILSSAVANAYSDEIAGFSIPKDAMANALCGVSRENVVILKTTNCKLKMYEI
jgi:hypothetical protein